MFWRFLVPRPHPSLAKFVFDFLLSGCYFWLGQSSVQSVRWWTAYIFSLPLPVDLCEKTRPTLLILHFQQCWFMIIQPLSWKCPLKSINQSEIFHQFPFLIGWMSAIYTSHIRAKSMCKCNVAENPHCRGSSILKEVIVMFVLKGWWWKVTHCCFLICDQSTIKIRMYCPVNTIAYAKDDAASHFSVTINVVIRSSYFYW